MSNATAPLIQEPFATGGFLIAEAPGDTSRDTVLFDNTAGTADLVVEAGTVFAALPPTVSAFPGSNTGNGTIGGLGVSMVPGQGGTYKLTLTSPGAFTVTGPDGTALPPGAVGTPYGHGIGFTLSAGSIQFVAGDGFNIMTITGLPPMDVPAAGNTGNGIMTNLSAYLSAAGMIGIYSIAFADPLNPTTFSVTAPDGRQLAPGVVGTPYADGIAFTITAGGTPFAIGDTFGLSVAPATAGRVTAWDGSAPALGVIFSTRTVPAGQTLAIATITRKAEVAVTGLRFPRAPYPAAQQTAIAQLQTLGIIARAGV